MTDDTRPEAASAPTPQPGDTNTPHPARVWNYWLGGRDNYSADRQLGEEVEQVFPDIANLAREGRGFLVRAVTYLAGEAGVRQFLDVGTGMPSANNTHEVAQSVAPESRIVYVDYDPLVLRHAHALLVGTPEGSTDYVHADLRSVETIIAEARQRLDFSQPIALMLMGILGHVRMEEAHAALRPLVDALPPGSYLALWDGAATTTSIVEGQERHNDMAAVPYYVRSPEEIATFFEGLDLVEPGLVACPHWDPAPFDLGSPPDSPSRCGVARKPF